MSAFNLLGRTLTPLRTQCRLTAALVAVLTVLIAVSQTPAGALNAERVFTSSGTNTDNAYIGSMSDGDDLVVVISNFSDQYTNPESSLTSYTAGSPPQQNRWTRVAVSGNQDGYGDSVSIWVSFNIDPGNTTLEATATPVGDGNDTINMVAYLISGQDGHGLGRLDGTSTNYGYGTSISTGGATISSGMTDFAVVGATASRSALSNGYPFGDFEFGTNVDPYGAAEDAFVSSASSVNGTMSASPTTNWAAAIATFTSY